MLKLKTSILFACECGVWFCVVFLTFIISLFEEKKNQQNSFLHNLKLLEKS